VLTYCLFPQVALEFFEARRRGEIEIIERRGGKLLPISAVLLRTPSTKPWIKDATALIIKNLEGMAFTVDELASILDLPAKSIESKMKELRKPGVKDRVFQFIDIELQEWRWGLIKEAEEIVNSEEFGSSFEPIDPDEAFVLMAKNVSGESYHQVIFTPKDVIRDPKWLTRKIPMDEIYELKIMPLSDSLLKTMAPKYYHVPRELAPYIALNGASYLQKLKAYG